jgi:hypothetical protein
MVNRALELRPRRHGFDLQPPGVIRIAGPGNKAFEAADRVGGADDGREHVKEIVTPAAPEFLRHERRDPT